MVKFIHAADLHLDSPYIGLKELSTHIAHQIKESTFQSLENIIQKAIDHQVDFVIFSGDIYDLEDRSIKAQIAFRQQMDRLETEKIAVYLIHGNHDFLANTADHLSLPSNVNVFSSSVETVYIETEKGEKVALSGFSYNKRWVTRRMIEDYPQRDNQCDYHIGLLHGYEEGQYSEHGKYAPFSLSELKSKHYDYWALGHIHNRQMLSSNPPVYYSGNTQGRHKNETGDKGCLLVEISHTKQQVDFISTAPVIWETLKIDASNDLSLNSIYEKLKGEIDALEKRNTLLNLVVSVSPHLTDKVMNKLRQEEFIDALHNYSESAFLYVTALKINSPMTVEEDISLAQLFPEEWNKSVEHFLDKEAFYKETKELLSTQPFSNELNEPTERMRKEIVDSAVTLLTFDLGSIEGD
ncbi:MAG: DNA repair exonuclease [Alkalibacterium sp.]|nr:DNA repair exonuclease [Alkalibacterium sp.]